MSSATGAVTSKNAKNHASKRVFDKPIISICIFSLIYIYNNFVI